MGLPRKKTVMGECPWARVWPLCDFPSLLPTHYEHLSSGMPSLPDGFKLCAKINHSSFRYSLVLRSQLRVSESIHKQPAPRQPPHAVDTEVWGCTILACKAPALTQNLLKPFLCPSFFLFLISPCCSLLLLLRQALPT